MNIIIRNVSATAIKKIDEKAKEKKISRQEFLKVNLKRRELLRGIEDYDKGRREEP